jgi:fatty acyl-ACP thioesterase B
LHNSFFFFVVVSNHLDENTDILEGSRVKDRRVFAYLSFSVVSLLQPKRSDLDMNQHVNNVKYIGWMMEVRICLPQGESGTYQ